MNEPVNLFPYLRFASGRLEETPVALQPLIDEVFPEVLGPWARSAMYGFKITFPQISDDLRDWLACLPCSLEMWTARMEDGQFVGWVYWQFPFVQWFKRTTYAWLNGVEQFDFYGLALQERAGRPFANRWFRDLVPLDADFLGGWCYTQEQPPWPELRT